MFSIFLANYRKTHFCHIFPPCCYVQLLLLTVIRLPSHSSMVVTGCGHTDFALGIPCRVRALAEPVTEVIVTCREQGEEVIKSFGRRGIWRN